MACREVLRKLDSLGVISLPAQKWGGAKWLQYSLETTGATSNDVITTVTFSKITIVRVDSKGHPLAPTWNSLVDEHHYLHSSRIVGRQLKYIATYEGAPIACLGWGDCAWAQSSRDSWIGWNASQRMRNRHLVINNSRFLILPWIKVPNLASWVIAACSNLAVRDWAEQYAITPALLETFVDSERFLGTCYRAANWQQIGVTAGYAKVGNSHHNSQSPKLVFAYPTTRRFRDLLRGRRK
ncbi:Druantia anti-phage system protein DruA [Anatilimnocola floriformis]|uniref:Druantia anti-phage system protein DruA n=1 Tax=Anatilimnocola floriformis TaxID=2948575 RepID=UPI0036F324A2